MSEAVIVREGEVAEACLRKWAARFDDVVTCPVGVGPDPHDVMRVLAELSRLRALITQSQEP